MTAVMHATYVPPKLFKYTRDEAAQAYWKACVDLAIPPTVKLVSVLVAHGALESGHFQVGCWNNNPGNVKATASYMGKFTCITLNENLRDPKTGIYTTRWFAPEGELTGSPRKGGKLKGSPLPVPPGHVQTRIRAFDTLDDGLENKIRMLSRWPGVLEAARAGDASKFVRAIRIRGYFTATAAIPFDQPTPYEREVISLTRTYTAHVEAVAARAKAGAELRPAPTFRVSEPTEAPIKVSALTLDDDESGEKPA